MMIPAEIIRKKRDGLELEKTEIQEFIQGLTEGKVADYQASAFLMAVFLKGMTLQETVTLTEAMKKSGTIYDLSRIPGIKVDKHSTGGVGDKVSIILAPLAAACGLKVPMMAGRGLGHSGGTLDKLESIPGFQCSLSKDRFEEILSSVGCAIMGQTEQICPADRKLYALRDVTATVDCLPLIVASILSKKAAEGTDALILDVKAGNGAFMQTRTEAKKLAKTLIQVSRPLGLKTRALITNMDQPLGYAVGNSLEVLECLEILRGEKSLFIQPHPLCSADLKEITIQLCAQMLEVGRKVKTLAEGRKLAHLKLQDGSAYKKFLEMLKAQGVRVHSNASPAPKIPFSVPLSERLTTWTAKKKGYLNWIDTTAIGNLLISMGGGRIRADDKIDHGVGMLFHRKLGSKVLPGDALVTAYLPHESSTADLEFEKTFQKSIEISNARKPVPKLMLDAMTS